VVAPLTAHQREDLREAFRLTNDLGHRLTFPVQNFEAAISALGGLGAEVIVHGETHKLQELFCPASRAAIERYWLPVKSKHHLARLIYSLMFQHLPHLVESPPTPPGKPHNWWRGKPAQNGRAGA
jgi:hypothetical protein